MAHSTVSGILTRIGMGKRGRLGLKPAVRYERVRPGELIDGAPKSRASTPDSGPRIASRSAAKEPRVPGSCCGKWRRSGMTEEAIYPNFPVTYSSVHLSSGAVKIFSVGATSTSLPTRFPASSLSTLKNAVRSETRAACCMLCVTMTIE